MLPSRKIVTLFTAILYRQCSASQFLLKQSSGEPSSQSAASCQYQNYVALGDSYAAGILSIDDKVGRLPICNGSNGGYFGPYCTTEGCDRNRGAYSWQFTQTNHPAAYAFLSCSGANTDDCAKNQIPVIPSNADLITINIGGNNGASFSTVVKNCVYAFPHKAPACATALFNAANTVTNILPDLTALFSQINTAAPQAAVVVFGYARFWPNNTDLSLCRKENFFLGLPTAAEKTAMNTLVTDLNAQLAQAVSAFPTFEFIDPNTFYETHRLCDTATPFFQFMPTVGCLSQDPERIGEPDFYADCGVFHPTLDGQRVYTNLLALTTGCQGAK